MYVKRNVVGKAVHNHENAGFVVRRDRMGGKEKDGGSLHKKRHEICERFMGWLMKSYTVAAKEKLGCSEEQEGKRHEGRGWQE